MIKAYSNQHNLNLLDYLSGATIQHKEVIYWDQESQQENLGPHREAPG